MTSDERKQAFAAAYNALVQEFGVVVVAVAQNEQLSGGELLIKQPKVDLALVDNWQSQPIPEQRVSEGLYKVPMDSSALDISPNGHKEVM